MKFYISYFFTALIALPIRASWLSCVRPIIFLALSFLKVCFIT